LSSACREYGLKFGVYLSPWDRNHPNYGTPEYNETFKSMLKEVLTSYGPVFEVWFDGANGEGPNGKRQVYDWPGFVATVRQFQPMACIFSDAGPDVRWVGNESGFAAPTCWSTLNRDLFVPGTELSAQLTEGHEGGTHWVPAECDVSIRPGWFWRKSEDARVKSPETLLDLYLRSVGQNGSLLLNVPADSRGLIHENDAKALMGFRDLREALFAHPVKLTNPLASSMTDRTHGPDQATDAKWETSWRARLNNRLAWVRFDIALRGAARTLVLEEAIQFGQSVKKFEVWASNSGKRSRVGEGTTIGHKRILRVEIPGGATQLEIRITDAIGPVALSGVALFQ
jgi:alpha-L-fucosidase